jgi:2-oxoglutarate ferredoxin oxidoreductase subunit gamma
MKRREIKVGGFGGQGIILSGYIIGKAASLHDKKRSALTQAYGPEARGGACSAEVVVAEEEIHNPFLKAADVMMLMSQESFNRFSPSVKKGGLILIDQDLVDPHGTSKDFELFAIPATKMAEELGRRIIANIVMLGFFAAMADVVSKEAMEEAIKSSVPRGTEELNLKAFRSGYDYGASRRKGKHAGGSGGE